MATKHLHVFFIPLLAHGHMIPMIDIARSFAEHGVLVSIITTPLNASLFQKTIDRATLAGHHIKLHLLQFPCCEAGLPDGCENTDHITSPAMLGNFFKAISMLQSPFDRLVEEHLPDCIVSDIFLPWTASIARKHGIPRLFFNGSSFFSTCAWESISLYRPHEKVDSDMEKFVLPGLPDPIKMTRSQLPDFFKEHNGFANILGHIKEANDMSYGIVMNTFYELEPSYADYYRREMGKKAWHIGPMSLCNRDVTDKADRWSKTSIDEANCLRWLDSMKPGSVVYVCFGSVCSHAARQLLEISLALEASGHAFIWVVRKEESPSSSDGFEERMEGKGLIIRWWAPQFLILNHPSIGAFVTHCGWNSVLEGVSAGVPMITWPAFAEQFCNEKMITDVLKIGVGVGVVQWVSWPQEEWPLVKGEQIEMAVRRVMDGGEEAYEMRKRAKELGKMAKAAVEEGGSSYVDLSCLIEELIKMRGEQKE